MWKQPHLKELDKLPTQHHYVPFYIQELIEELEKFENTAEQFYAVRDWDHNKDYYLTLTDVQKAA